MIRFKTYENGKKRENRIHQTIDDSLAKQN